MRFSFFSIIFICLNTMAVDGQSLKVSSEIWGKTESGEEVIHYTLNNKQGVEVQIMSLGCIITSIKTPDKKGNISEITLGFNDLESYLKGHPAFGSVMGRVTNRTKNASFVLDGQTFELEKNMGEHHIHGGSNSFNKVVWQSKDFSDSEEVGVEFTYQSPDGDGGFPGTVDAKVRYALNDEGELSLEYSATTDKPTHINMTNHAYFNFNGAVANVDDHQVVVNADFYTDSDETAMPTGQILTVEGTPLDLRESTRLGDRFPEMGSGFDHNYVISKERGQLGLAAIVIDPESGRKMEVFTTQPGVQLYTANWSKDRVMEGRDGLVYKTHYGLCLETQDFPTAANYGHFPSTVLRPGELYDERVIFKFSVAP